MATSVEGVASLVEGLSIAETTPDTHTQIPIRSSSTRPKLQKAIQTLSQSAQITEQHVHSLAGDEGPLRSLQISEICSLRRTAKELADITRILDETANQLKNATETSIIAHLSSLGGSQLQGMLSHFEQQIRSIVESVLDNSSDDNCVLWKIAEECYNQATSTSGTLHSDNYWIQRDEACLEWPYDPDFESEEYYEHESRLEIDEDYAEAFQERIERRSERESRERQRWVDFWALVLNGCPGGPTLFKISNSDIADIPRYLFRTFDAKSSGRNDDVVMASSMSTIESLESSRIDLLSLEKHRATEMLHTHLAKPCHDGRGSDNLMSWTSSLLFAIQYSIWRCHTFRCHPADVKICAVDTRRFPQGQFARDMWLLQSYRSSAAQLGGETQNFFRFRLEDERYHNGEYFSQGSVNHEGRSCIASLESLEKTGLYDLYPEFADAQGRKRWANRALELRQAWSTPQVTTSREIKLAFMVAEKCFNNFEALDIALSLLAFKNRKYQSTTASRTTRGGPEDINKHIPEWSRKPDEVQRYFIAAELVKLRNQSTNQSGYAWFRNVLSDIQMVEGLFEHA